MRNESKIEVYSRILNIIIWGSIWGICEATVGYLLHLVSFEYSWIIWYPVACFFMTNVYSKNKDLSSIVYVALFCAAIKMLNLFLPGRIDKVINPAISIVFESFTMVGVVYVTNLFSTDKKKNSFIKALMSLTMNTGWRILFAIYLLFLVPEWIRDVSVISSNENISSFFITQNLVTSTLIFIGYQFKTVILKLVENIENRSINAIPSGIIPASQASLATIMLCSNIALQFILK